MSSLRSSREIQGNVLAPFPDEQQAFLLLRFTGQSGARELLTDLLPGITTTAELLQSPPCVCRGVGLTRSGLSRLAPEWQADLEPFVAFHEGALARAPRLRDVGPSGPERWVFGGPRQPTVDAVLTLAAVDPEALSTEAVRWREQAESRGVELVFDQRGARLPGAMAGCEHFGFKDGISQPAVRGFDPADPEAPEERTPTGARLLPAGEIILGRPRLATAGGESPPAPCADWMRDGSFQVLRRMTQDVPGWRAQLTQLAAAISAEHPISADHLAAKLIGRWQSGTPLAVAPDRDAPAFSAAEPDFTDDPCGFKTPRFAHIRKMYPRDDQFFERDWHRIIRRGVPFGPIYDPAAEVDAERGLLLNAFMASVENQFEFLMQAWANDPDFITADDGPDPLVGHSDMPATLRHPDGCRWHLRFERFVHTTGTVYAFAPALSALKGLAKGAFRR
jgi:Dyp-type peroxidase family